MPVNKTQEQLQAIYPDFEIGFDSPPAAKRIEPPRKRAKILHNVSANYCVDDATEYISPC